MIYLLHKLYKQKNNKSGAKRKRKKHSAPITATVFFTGPGREHKKALDQTRDKTLTLCEKKKILDRRLVCHINDV